MSVKSTSHEAAQRKVWQSELKLLDKNQRAVERDFNRARAPLAKAAKAAAKKLAAFDARASRQLPRTVKAIERRRGILKGKLGL
jgi:hypothetical protein